MLGRFLDLDEEQLHRLQQRIKWTIYALLIVNFGFYLAEDWNRAMHTIEPGDSIFKWLREFSTSIDESAWFILLFMFELETYVLEEESWTGWVAKTVHGARIACFLMIAHTVFAYVVAANELEPTVLVENASTACDVVDQDLSWVYNLEYTKITPDNCEQLSDASQIYRVGDDPVVASLEGLELERDLALADVIEAIAWLLAVLAIEFVVRLQERGIAGGRLMSILNWTKVAMYTLILGVGVYWAALSHWLYLWDEIVWIGGFAIIEMNLVEWREEIREHHTDPKEATA